MAEGAKILIVDDDADIRRATATSLRRAGYEIAEADDGDVGLRLILKFVPDLIVLDMMMPKVNGLEFCERLVGEMRLRGVRILLHSSISGNSKIVREIREMEEIVSDFLQKPSAPAAMREKVEAILGGKTTALPKTIPRAATAATAKPGARPTPTRRATTPGSMTSATPGPENSQKPPASALRLLMVDDDLDLLRANKMALRKQYKIATAENGLIGIELLESFAPDFILVDFNMPVMDGLEMVETMRRHPHFRYIPALFLSGNREQDLPKRAFESGCNLFLRKPIDPARLGRSLAHFVKESGIKPGGRPGDAPGGAPGTQAAGGEASGPEAGEKKVKRVKVVRKKKVAGAGPRDRARDASAHGQRIRLVIVGAEAGQRKFLEKLLGDKFAGKTEVLWAEDHRTTLVNLPRWEPDVLLYNPRTPSLEGIGFFQMLRIKKVETPFMRGFVGAEIPEPDRDYSGRHFGREVVDLAEGPGPAADAMRAFLNPAAEKIRGKRLSVKEIEMADEENDAKIRSAKERDARQQAALRERYGEIQRFINRDLGGSGAG